MRRFPRSVVLLVLGIGTVGCPARDEGNDATTAAEAADSAAIIQSESGILSAAVEGGSVAKPTRAVATSEQVALAASLRMSQFFQPAGCLLANVAGDTVTYVFSDCTGPRGLVHVTGTVTVVYSVDATGFHADASATGLKINRTTLDIDSSVDFSVEATTRTMTVQTSGAGTGPLGHHITHTGAYTLSWGDGCATLDGAWSTTIGALTRSTTVSNLTACEGECPADGGSISHTGLGGVSFTIQFDGSNVADWSTSSGLSGTLNLACNPA